MRGYWMLGIVGGGVALTVAWVHHNQKVERQARWLTLLLPNRLLSDHLVLADDAQSSTS